MSTTSTSVEAPMADTPFLIYGASDDLVEIEGPVSEELSTFNEPCVLVLESPTGERLQVVVHFDHEGWHIAVIAAEDTSHPSWPIRFTGRPDRPLDPAVQIDAPKGTTINRNA